MIGHVLTHLAPNADRHSWRLDGALCGEDVPRYPGGAAQRSSEIDAGAPRPAADIIAGLIASPDRLEMAWEASTVAGWPHLHLRGDDHWPATASPARRLREVEMHHVDLGLGYEPSGWPADYVAWELPRLLATVPSRLQRSTDARDLVASLSGRGPVPAAIQLGPWRWADWTVPARARARNAAGQVGTREYRCGSGLEPRSARSVHRCSRRAVRPPATCCPPA
jgi:maleylpyruvate isomerase